MLSARWTWVFSTRIPDFVPLHCASEILVKLAMEQYTTLGTLDPKHFGVNFFKYILQVMLPPLSSICPILEGMLSKSVPATIVEVGPSETMCCVEHGSGSFSYAMERQCVSSSRKTCFSWTSFWWHNMFRKYCVSSPCNMCVRKRGEKRWTHPWICEHLNHHLISFIQLVQHTSF